MLSTDKESINEWTALIIKTGARSRTAQRVTGITDIHSRDFYKRIHGKKSPSGLGPSDPTWFTKNPERVFASTLFFGLYKKCLAHDGDRNVAFMHAYYHFWRINGSPAVTQKHPDTLTPERADNLRKRLRDQESLKGKGNTSSHKLYKCRVCSTSYLGESNTAHNVCPLCDKDKHH